jgi:hypothetical protein
MMCKFPDTVILCTRLRSPSTDYVLFMPHFYLLEIFECCTVCDIPSPYSCAKDFGAVTHILSYRFLWKQAEFFLDLSLPFVLKISIGT